MNDEIDKIIHKLKSTVSTSIRFADYVNAYATAKEAAGEQDLKDYCTAAINSAKTARELLERLEELVDIKVS